MRIRRTHGFYPLSVIQKGSYEGFRLRGNNGVTVAAQSSHSGGSPINQRECATACAAAVSEEFPSIFQHFHLFLSIAREMESMNSIS